MTIPSSTYRIQFNPKFNFSHLTGIIDYLEELGITAIYASPILQPSKGSEHGYNGIDPSVLNPELGTEEELATLTNTLRQKGIGWIQDIVPNHLAFDTTNVWLKDVFERGINSSYAGHFDIDWEHPFYQQKLMVPFLEASVQECLQQKKLKLVFNEEGYFIAYYENFYPLNIESYPPLLSGCFEDEFNHVNSSVSALLNNIKTSFDHWQNLKKELLQQLTDENVVARIQEKVEQVNQDDTLLLQIISNQYYALAYHMDSNIHVNYRRFFNVNGLICLRVEDELVFADYHRYIHHLYEKGYIQGLRIDHIDGLKNPTEYISRLRTLFGKECYIIVEKILDIKEELPKEMEIEGTSGYEFLSFINQVITDSRGSEKLLTLYHKYAPKWSDYPAMVFDNKLSNLESYLNGEWDNLIRLLLSLNLIDDEEIRMKDLKMALGVFMAAYPVYRAYIDQLPMDENDTYLAALAFDKAMKKYPDLKYELSVLQELFKPHEDPIRHNNRLLFVQRLMQFTGPLAAKGVEDTTFYRYNALISHNEVGDQPSVLGISVTQFHEQMQERLKTHPFSFNCTSTHDTKRGEDARVRINIISELTDEWAGLMARWQQINEPFRKIISGKKAPIVNDIYFLYQAIVGAFPEDLHLTEEFVTRTKTYFTKVLRESKFMSDHVAPNTAYEEASMEFIDHLLNPRHEFLPTLIPFVEKIIGYANTYTMVQVIIKCTAPGIPDIYQGCELWDLSYVDPDNRRPVNYNLRRSLLRELEAKGKESKAAQLEWANENYPKGAEKLWVTKEMLRLRKQQPRLFSEGDYIPIYPDDGERVVIAYCRRFQNQWILVVLPLGIVENTGKSLILAMPEAAPTNWKNIYTDEEVTGPTVDVHDLFQKFPVAVLRGN